MYNVNHGDYDKRNDPKRKQEIKMEKHELKLVGDNLPSNDNQVINIFGETGFSYYSNKVVYMIRNTETGKMYIGQTEDIRKRKSKHASDLNQTKHENTDIQMEYILYGSDKFIFEAIEFLGKEEKLLERERYWIKYFNSEWPNGYNAPYETNPDYSKRESKRFMDELIKAKKEDTATCLGKTRNYKNLIETINKYKRTHWEVGKTWIWKSR